MMYQRAPNLFKGIAVAFGEEIRIEAYMTRTVGGPIPEMWYLFDGQITSPIPPRLLRWMHKNKSSVPRFLVDFGVFRIKMVVQDWRGKVESTGSAEGYHPIEELWKMAGGLP